MEKANSANKRAWIGTTIEAMKAKRDIIGLIKALEHKETDIRGAAAEALGETKHAGAVKFLTKALRDKNWSVRNKAAWALHQIGEEEWKISRDSLCIDRCHHVIADRYCNYYCFVKKHRIGPDNVVDACSYYREKGEYNRNRIFCPKCKCDLIIGTEDNRFICADCRRIFS